MVRAWLLLRPDLDEQYLTASYRVYLNEADAKKGISTGDFSEALAALLGKDAAGLSASAIGRLKEA
jgi:hypothetical protein